MALTPINKRPNNCINSLEDFDLTTSYNPILETAFEDGEPDCFTVYKNFNYAKEYKALIREGKAIKSGYPYKTFLSYPYPQFEFRINDYVSFEYGGRLTHWLIMSLDRQRLDDCRGHIWLCNNLVKWKDEYNKVHSWPCFFEENIQRGAPRYNKTMVVTTGLDECTVQYNEETKNLKVNDRLLFNGMAYKIVGIGNHNMEVLDDNDSIQCLRLILETCNLEENDDVENNIANAFDIENTYEIKLDVNSVYCSIGDTGTINGTVYKNGVVVNEELSYSIVQQTTTVTPHRHGYCKNSNAVNNHITINENGSWNVISNGTDKVKVSMVNNSDIAVYVDFTVSDVIVPPVTSVTEINIEPRSKEIYEGDTNEYTVVKTIDGVVIGDSYTIEDITVGATGCYEFNVNGDTFSIANKKRSKDKVKIKITDSVGNFIEEEFTLKGMF